MKIGQLAKRSGFTAHTIRYYERIGLLPPCQRDAADQREYDEDALVWIAFLGRLKATGMPIRDMKRYAQLRDQGPSTAIDRRKILQAHRDALVAHIAKLQQCLLSLDQKIDIYLESESEATHDANPTPDGRDPPSTRSA